MANAIDLTDVNAVTSYLKQNAGAAIISGEAAAYDNDLIQGMITGLSQHWLTQTGRASLNSLEDVSEVYDGNGSWHLFTDNWPINSIASLAINGQALPFSNDYQTFGIYIERSKKSVAIRPGGAGGGQVIVVGFGGIGPYKFYMGRGNVFISYNYGFDGAPADIGQAVTWQVAQAYRRRDHVDKKTMAMGAGAGNTTYYDWEWSPDVMRVLNSYKRVAVR